MMKLFLFFVFVAVGAAHAQPGGSAAASNYQNAGNTEGFCVSLNREHPYFKEGMCTSLIEQLKKDTCTAPLLEKIRKKMEASLGDNPPTEKKDQFYPGFTCGSRTDADADKWKEISKKQNKATFDTIVAQLAASIVVAETNWDTFFQLEKGPGQNINQGKQGGLANITLKQMDDPKYAQGGGDGGGNCGCKVTNSRKTGFLFWKFLLGDFAMAQNAAGGGWPEGDSPGPRDPHHSIGCAAHMLLVEAEKDGKFFGGTRAVRTPAGGTPPPPTPDDNKPQGGSKIWKSLEEWDDAPDTTNPDPNNEILSKNPKLNLIKKKMKLYCKQNVNDNGGMTRTIDEDIDDSGNVRAPGTNR
jgi:hypothetical protein